MATQSAPVHHAYGTVVAVTSDVCSRHENLINISIGVLLNKTGSNCTKNIVHYTFFLLALVSKATQKEA